MDWGVLAKATVTLFAVVDPVGTIPFFLAATRTLSTPEARRAAGIAAVTVWAVLAAAALLGEHALRFFDIRVESFAVAGGLLLLMLSLSMLQAHVSPLRQTPEEAMEAEEKEAIGAVPLGVPLLAGPGAITQVIVAAGDTAHPAALLIPITLVSLSVWLAFRAAPFIAHRLGRTGIHIVTRLMGLIIAALSVEMIARGLAHLFPGWMT
ncbi:MAG: NAAT family transporter [Burkholderiales bacterium]